jgi:hypothetical protein
VLVVHGLLGRFSVLDVLVHLSRIYKVKLGDGWAVAEIPRASAKILEKLDNHITQNL